MGVVVSRVDEVCGATLSRLGRRRELEGGALIGARGAENTSPPGGEKDESSNGNNWGTIVFGG